MAAHRKMPKDELFAKLAALKESGHTAKEMARKLGNVYSFRYIQSLCSLLSIQVSRLVDGDQQKAQAGSGRGPETR
jgi:hypothetical protein